MPRFEPSLPHANGILDVGEGHRLHFEEHGNPAGKPVICVHGGPGSGCDPGWARWFDPSRYRIVLLDQRGCGRSIPYAGEPAADLSTNTTAHLVADMERLRDHLGIGQWMVFGASWGSTLALAYAESHPDRVSELVLFSVVTTTRREVRWVTRDMRRVFPAAWESFAAHVALDERDNLPAAYHRLLMNADPSVHGPAAEAWCAWEDTHVDVEGRAVHDPRYDDPRFRLCFARLVTHYWSNAAFLDDDELVRNAARLSGIPGVLVAGQLDVSGPPDIAYDLARVWPDAELVISSGGHGTGDDLVEAVLAATARFAPDR